MAVLPGFAKQINESLVWKWYFASLKSSNINRAPACFGLGTEVQDCTEAVQQELGWWPCRPVVEWRRERITTDPQMFHHRDNVR